MPKPQSLLKETLSEGAALLAPPCFHSPAVTTHAIAIHAIRSFEAEHRTDELEGLLNLVAKSQPEQITVVGSHNKGNVFALAQVAPRSAQIISIDTNEEHIGMRERSKLARLRFSGQKIDYIHEEPSETSQPDLTRRQLEKKLGGRAIDFLFLDSEGSYTDAKEAVTAYAPLVRGGGMIALHDILHTASDDGGVAKLWDELKEKYYHDEIVSPGSLGRLGPGTGGIGILEKPRLRLVSEPV